MEEKLDFLIKYLSDEREDMKVDLAEVKSIEEKKKIYRMLCNMRNPREISDEYVKIENEYLSEVLKEENIIDSKDIKVINEVYGENKLENGNKIALLKGDITKIKIDAIVNAANYKGLGCFSPLHNCLDNIIHTNAGVALRLECFEKMKEINFKLEEGRNILTNGYNLPAKFVIHSLGPEITGDVTLKKENALADCYRYAMYEAMKNGIKEIAFPCISTGVFRFPKRLAVKIAIETVEKMLNEIGDKFSKIIFCVYSSEDLALYEEYIKQNLKM